MVALFALFSLSVRQYTQPARVSVLFNVFLTLTNRLMIVTVAEKHRSHGSAYKLSLGSHFASRADRGVRAAALGQQQQCCSTSLFLFFCRQLFARFQGYDCGFAISLNAALRL